MDGYELRYILVFFSINDTIILQDVVEPEVLGSLCSADYVWDDLTLPHELVVQINGTCKLFFLSRSTSLLFIFLPR